MFFGKGYWCEERTGGFNIEYQSILPKGVAIVPVSMIQQLDMLSDYRNEEMSVIMGKAWELGIKKLWQETCLESYLKNKITREEAVIQIGLDMVIMAEEQRKMAKEDVRWGLYGE
ncbi:MAG: hypothetical protein ABH870_02125 [bacterium]